MIIIHVVNRLFYKRYFYIMKISFINLIIYLSLNIIAKSNIDLNLFII